MPTRQQIEAVLRNHFETWNSRDKEGWMANFSENLVVEDPVGGLLKTGVECQEKSWELSFQDGHGWTLEPVLMQVCTNKAAIHVKNIGTVDNEPVEFDSIEIWTVDDNCKICDVRVYFNPEEGQTVDPYFQQIPRE